MSSSFKTENLWSGLQHVFDKQLQQEKEINSLKEKWTASKAKIEEANRLEKSHREEVNIVRKGVHLTEILLLQRITALDEKMDGKHIKQSGTPHNSSAVEELERSHATLVNRLDKVERESKEVPSFVPHNSEQSHSNIDADAVKEAMDKMANEIASVKHQLGAKNPSSKGSSFMIGDSTPIGDPVDMYAYLQNKPDLNVNVGMLIGYDIIFQMVYDAEQSNFNQLESLKIRQLAQSMHISPTEGYALFCLKLRLPQMFCSSKSGPGGLIQTITHSDWRPTTGSILSGVDKRRKRMKCRICQASTTCQCSVCDLWLCNPLSNTKKTCFILHQEQFVAQEREAYWQSLQQKEA